MPLTFRRHACKPQTVDSQLLVLSEHLQQSLPFFIRSFQPYSCRNTKISNDSNPCFYCEFYLLNLLLQLHDLLILLLDRLMSLYLLPITLALRLFLVSHPRAPVDLPLVSVRTFEAAGDAQHHPRSLLMRVATLQLSSKSRLEHTATLQYFLDAASRKERGRHRDPGSRMCPFPCALYPGFVMCERCNVNTLFLHMDTCGFASNRLRSIPGQVKNCAADFKYSCHRKRKTSHTYERSLETFPCK